MLFGIDVGGTHTDAVLLDKEGGIISAVKIPTDTGDLLGSLTAAIEEILKDSKGAKIERFNLSTTLCTNAIVQDELVPVGVLVTAGPGINPSLFRLGEHFEIIEGALDHRGTEIKPLDLKQAEEVISNFKSKGIDVFAVVGKFSPRNPVHEQKLASLLEGKASFITMGHTLSGQLNFPRRIATAYYNSAVWPIFNSFLNSVWDSLKKFHLSPQLNILKADGGTMPLSKAKHTPVESIFSGPAASVMGIIALCDIKEDALVLDIGGTTTDIGVFASGEPLIEPENVSLRHRPTLVRAMKVKSIGLGGDSAILVEDGILSVGPKRMGPAMAKGGNIPTLLDALNCLSHDSYGDKGASKEGMKQVGEKLLCKREEAPTRVIEAACRKLKEEITAFLREINERPIYTVHELLEYRKIEPKVIYLMGGPAEIVAPYIKKEFGLPVIIPEHSSVANAIGAAVARPTLEVELFADTEKKIMTIPVFDIKKSIPGSYSLHQAREETMSHLMAFIKREFGWEVSKEDTQIIEESCMNMVKDVFTVGQDIRVKCQIKPGICKEYENVVRCLCREQKII